MEELAVLFRELNTLIVEQGTMLDRIDHNIEEVRLVVMLSCIFGARLLNCCTVHISIHGCLPHGCPVLQAVEHSKKGVVELKVAENYQKSARPIMCMGILMVLIVIMVIGKWQWCTGLWCVGYSLSRQFNLRCVCEMLVIP